jgi:hypothetical protein
VYPSAADTTGISDSGVSVGSKVNGVRAGHCSGRSSISGNNEKAERGASGGKGSNPESLVSRENAPLQTHSYKTIRSAQDSSSRRELEGEHDGTRVK